MADFLLTWVLVYIFNYWYVGGNMAGNISGAAAQFLLSKYWVFTKTGQTPTRQLFKFTLMWMGNILLSALGVYLLTNYAHLHYMTSKLLVSASLGVSYTYLVSKRLVFN
ncbi:MAG: GtrA family protein [Chitinophagaceae bacterium]|nr:GtrA family protein [Chitinophagaceae bacterium]